MFPVSAAFGPSLINMHHAAAGDSSGDVHCHAEGPLVVGEPNYGDAPLKNSDVQGSVLLLTRGKVTFATKALLGQEAGAKLVLVCQTDAIWPYTMTDKRGESEALTVPCLCVSLPDARDLLDLDGKAARVFTRETDIMCPVCQEELKVGTEAVKLPCLHLYHQDCILPWLQKRNTCPMCRFELPTESKSDAQAEHSRHNHSELNRSMFS